MNGRLASSMIFGLVACGPALDTAATGNSGSSSSSSSSSSAGDEQESSSAGGETQDTDTAAECRVLAGPLAARWSSLVDPDTLGGGNALLPTANGGAVVATSLSMVRLDGLGTPLSVHWFGALAPGAFALGSDEHLWVGGDDGEIAVARYDDSGELGRASRDAFDDEERVVGLVREEGGVLVLTSGTALRLAEVDDARGFGAAVTLSTEDASYIAELHDGGLVTVTNQHLGSSVFTLSDRTGTQLWRTDLPRRDDDIPFPFVGTRTVVGEVVYVAATTTDLEFQVDPVHQLIGLSLNDGTMSFALDIERSVIAMTPCGTLYRVETHTQDDGPAVLVLVEHDASGAVLAEVELASPTPPPSFTLAEVRAIAVSSAGALLMRAELEDGDGARAQWVAAY